MDALYTPASGTLPRRMVRSDDLVKLSAGAQLIGLMPQLGMFVAMAMIGATAGIASAQLSAAFQQSVDPSYLGRSYSIVNLSDEAAMPVAMTAFGAFISLTSTPLACAVIGTASPP